MENTMNPKQENRLIMATLFVFFVSGASSMLMGNLMKFKLRIPSFFKGTLRTMTENTVNDLFNKNDYNDPSTMKAVIGIRNYAKRLGFSQPWVTDFVFQLVMLAKKEKSPNHQ